MKLHSQQDLLEDSSQESEVESAVGEDSGGSSQDQQTVRTPRTKADRRRRRRSKAVVKSGFVSASSPKVESGEEEVESAISSILGIEDTDMDLTQYESADDINIYTHSADLNMSQDDLDAAIQSIL